MSKELRWRQSHDDLLYAEFNQAAATNFDIAAVAGRHLRIKGMTLSAFNAALATVTIQSWDGGTATLDWKLPVNRVEGGLWTFDWKTYWDSALGEGIRFAVATTDVAGWVAYEAILPVDL